MSVHGCVLLRVLGARAVDADGCRCFVRAQHTGRVRRGPVASSKFRAPDTVLREDRDLGEVTGADLANHLAVEQFRISSSMSFIGRTSTHALAARLADWLCGLGDFDRDYKSAAVFLEVGGWKRGTARVVVIDGSSDACVCESWQVKLKEMESVCGELKSPNPIRAAVAIGLFDMFIRRLSRWERTANVVVFSIYSRAGLWSPSAHAHGLSTHRYAPTLVPIRHDLIECIYTKQSLAVRKHCVSHGCALAHVNSACNVPRRFQTSTVSTPLTLPKQAQKHYSAACCAWSRTLPSCKILLRRLHTSGRCCQVACNKRETKRGHSVSRMKMTMWTGSSACPRYGYLNPSHPNTCFHHTAPPTH